MTKNALRLLLMVVLLTLPTAVLAAQNVSAPQAREMLQQQHKPFLLDVRTPQEYFQVRLAGATLIPIDQVAQRLGEIPKGEPILVYCAVGSRSSQVAAYLSRAGYENVYNLYGGIWAWQVRGLPVEKGAP